MSITLIASVPPEQVERTYISHPTTSRGTVPEVFIEVNAVWQLAHEHLIDEIDRAGCGSCVGCGIRAWSEDWVSAGFMGDGTMRWTNDLLRSYMTRAEEDRAEFEQMRERAQNVHVPRMALIADLDPSQPA